MDELHKFFSTEKNKPYNDISGWQAQKTTVLDVQNQEVEIRQIYKLQS